MENDSSIERQSDAQVPRAATILLVEDDPSTRRVIRRMLESATYHVLEAGDGDAAFRVLNTRGAQIALVLTDIVLPKMNGVELTLYVKTQWPRIRIIAFTGQEESLIRSLGGFNLPVRLLHKPLEMTALLQAIAEELALER